MTTPQPADTPRADQWADLRALEAAATAGPWQATRAVLRRGGTGTVVADSDGKFVLCDPQADAHIEDAEFIAAARNAVPDLLAEVDRLRAALAEAEREAAEYQRQLQVEKWHEPDASCPVCTHMHYEQMVDDLEAEWGRTDAAEARAEQAERQHRDLTSRLGFGDNITEPQADNDTIVAWFEERGREADEWRESQRWRDECMLAGHPEDEDCWEHDPSLRLEQAERQVREAGAQALRDAANDYERSDNPPVRRIPK